MALKGACYAPEITLPTYSRKGIYTLPAPGINEFSYMRWLGEFSVLI